MQFNPNPIPNGSGGVVQCPKTIDKVIGRDGKVYCNACWARAMGTEAIANALPNQPCLPEGIEGVQLNSMLDWIKQYWYIPAAIIALLFIFMGDTKGKRR